jgi:hypothetical protein
MYKDLAALIRKGIPLHPPLSYLFYGPLDPNAPEGAWGTCAVGAAYEGATGHPPSPESSGGDPAEFLLIEQTVLDAAGLAGNATVRLPVEAAGRRPQRLPILQACYWLMDTAGWTREQIAAWLDRVGAERVR